MLSSSLSTTHGFHSVYSTQIIVDDHADIAKCTVHLLHIFPPRVFVDPYELLNHKDFYTFRLSGTSNLELPVMAVGPEGSALLLNILFPRAFHGTQNVTVDVPLHIRYGEPAQPRSPKTSDDGTVKVPWPTAFWACPSSCKFHLATWLAATHGQVKHLDLLIHSPACQPT
jgi:GPI mannosyltransferase 1 subunit X